MIFSYNWLKTFFGDDLPEIDDLKKGIEEHFFEVEGVEEVRDDYLLDINILPNRAADCLSYIGVAREISAIFNLRLKEDTQSLLVVNDDISKTEVNVKTDKCSRFMARKVENIVVGESPEWLKKRIESMGGRSINNIVDLTNFVLFETGQPLHAYDADKVDGFIVVREAREGEKFTTLDNKELELSIEDLVIADEAGALSLAGVKGGKKAEVTKETTSIILEAANFNPAVVRRSATRHGLRTDAVKRFENNLAPEKAEEGMKLVSEKILELIPGSSFNKWQDVFTPRERRVITTTPTYVSSRLGIDISEDKIVEILDKLRLEPAVEGSEIKVTIPFDRQDLEIEEDLVEEIGRLHGYEDVPIIVPDAKTEGESSKVFTISQKIKEILLESGFSEVYGYSFTANGQIEVASPLAKDRPFLREDLATSLKDIIAFNIKNILFDDEPVKVFEIGSVFLDEETEKVRAGIGLLYKKEKLFNKNKELIDEVKRSLVEGLGLGGDKIDFKETQVLPNSKESFRGVILEFNIEDILDDVKSDPEVNLNQFFAEPSVKYTPVSPYPRITRDIALFVKKDTKAEEVAEVLEKEAGDLLVFEPILFDEFTKEGEDKTSLAFRLVFQSKDRTLEDEEVNKIMDKIYEKVSEKGWEVR